MKKAVLYLIIAFVFLSAVDGVNIEEQIKECEESSLPDLCLASLTASSDLVRDSEKSRDELVRDCERSSYKDLCIGVVAKGLNRKEVCENIIDEFGKENCFRNFDISAAGGEEIVFETKSFETKREGFGIIFYVSLFVIIAALIIIFLRVKKLKSNISNKKFGMNKEMMNYIREARINGMEDEEIKKELLEAGWPEELIDKYLKR